MNHPRLRVAIVVSLLVTGCASVPSGQDVASAPAAVQSALGQARLPARDDGYLDPSWFEQTLTADRAVQAALLNNPRVRLELSRLDAAQAERVQAGLIRNPMLTLMTMRPEGGGRYELDYSLMQSLFDLFTRSRRVAVAQAAQRRIEAEVIVQLLTVAQDSQAAYYDALAAQATVGLQRERLALEESSSELLQRQASQGAVSTGMALEQQGATSMRAHELQAADAGLAQARSALARLLGLSSANAIRLPESLPTVALGGVDEAALQALAARNRAELRAAAAGVDQARAERDLQSGALRATEPSLGLVGVRETDGMRMNGLELQVLLPVFDTGRARRDLSSAQLAQAEFLAESVQRQVPLEVERALTTLAAAQLAVGHAEHHLRQQQLLEELARRNYEQGASDLLAYRRSSLSRLASAQDQIDARQALWTAAVDLQRATGVAAISQ